MQGIDLKLTKEDALKLLGAETNGAVERIRRTAETLAEQLSASSAAVKPIDIMKAEIAASIDFEQRYDGSPDSQLMLTFNGNGGGWVQLHHPVARGRFRALILIERLPTEET